MTHDALDEQIRQLRAEGLPWHKIAEALGLRRSTLHNRATRLGLTRPRKKLKRRNARIVRRARSGEPYAKIAADLGLTKQHVSSIARAAGVLRKEVLSK